MKIRLRVIGSMFFSILWLWGGMVYGVTPDSKNLPNIILVLADDLGYGELGAYGQKVIRTPVLDRMAADGMRFTQFYAGSTVCAPSRSVLMTGRQVGHAWVRGNGQGAVQSLREEDVTVAKVLQKSGYATALIGKWGLGDDVEGARQGLPGRQGFDFFYGYLNQVHAHNYYPDFLWRNDQRVPLHNLVRPVGADGGGVATRPQEYSPDLMVAEALKWIGVNRAKPFFLLLTLTLPHANNEAARTLGNGAEVPDFGPYSKENWPEPDKGHAAMVSRLDQYVGQITDQLRESGLTEHTLVLFSSDNGPHQESNQHLERFAPSGPLRGIKRDLYEGGIRVPMIAVWPGKIKGGTVSEHVGYFGDFMATACEIAGVPAPQPNDSLSFLPVLLGQDKVQKIHPCLYWEFYEGNGKQALRMGNWKGVRNYWKGPLELYDLARDPGEKHNLAEKQAAIVMKIEAAMKEAHTPSPNWKMAGE
jgi:arylsulfatase A-like enzyme